MRSWFIILFSFFVSIVWINAQINSQLEITETYQIKNKKTGQNLLTSNYDFLHFYGSSSFLIAKKDSKYGIIDEKESIILPFEYDTILFKRIKNERMGFNIPFGFVQKNNKYGLLDSLGNLTTSVHFDQPPQTNNHYGLSFSINELFGVVSYNGKVLVPFEYDKRIYLNQEFVAVIKNNLWGIYQLGKSLVIPTKFNHITIYSTIPVFVVINRDSKKTKKGMYNLQGDVLLPTIYDDISASPNPKGGTSFLSVSKDNKIGIVNSKGEFILPVEYENIRSNHPEGFIVRKEGNYGLIGWDGNLLMPFKYKGIEYRKNFRFDANIEAWRTDQRGYLVTEDGTHYDTTAFDDYSRFLAEYIILKKGKKNLLADWLGNIKPGTYDIIDCDSRTRKCFAYNEGIGGLIDYQGNVLLPFEYRGFDHLGFDSKYMWYMDIDYNVGVMNTDGLVILPAKYQKIDYFEDALKDPIYRKNIVFHAASESKWGLVTTKGEWIIPPEYDQLYYFNNGLAPAKKDGLWGVVNLKNEIITPFQFENVSLSIDGLDKIMVEEEWIKVDQKGNAISRE